MHYVEQIEVGIPKLYEYASSSTFLLPRSHHADVCPIPHSPCPLLYQACHQASVCPIPPGYTKLVSAHIPCHLVHQAGVLVPPLPFPLVHLAGVCLFPSPSPDNHQEACQVGGQAGSAVCWFMLIK